MMQQIPFFEKKRSRLISCLFTLAKQFQNKTAILQKYFLVFFATVECTFDFIKLNYRRLKFQSKETKDIFKSIFQLTYSHTKNDITSSDSNI